MYRFRFARVCVPPLGSAFLFTEFASATGVWGGGPSAPPPLVVGDCEDILGRSDYTHDTNGKIYILAMEWWVPGA